MIRERCEIDNELILHFLDHNPVNTSIRKNLLDWYALLGEKDFKKNRDKAIEFIRDFAKEVLVQIDFSDEDKDKLINVFEPLETILRTAQSLNLKSNVRDHLSHTVRVILFANYLFYEYFKISQDEAKVKREIFIAAIFHDMAYPIEKIKEIGNNLSEGTFKDLLNSKGKIDFNLNRPNDLLDLIDFWGSLPKRIEEEYQSMIERASAENKQKLQKQKEEICRKIIHIYKEIFIPAIAGQGLFNAKHNLSSVVLFLRPILKEWKDSTAYLNKKIESICDICLAIAYHDRSMVIDNFNNELYKTPIPVIVKMLRIADELQEWDRTRKEESFTESVLLDKTSDLLQIHFSQKDADKKSCNPYYFIPDKIDGLLPIINGNPLLVTFEMPTKSTLRKYFDDIGKDTKENSSTKNFIDLFKWKLTQQNYSVNNVSSIDNSSPIERISLSFKDHEVKVQFDSAATFQCQHKNLPAQQQHNEGEKHGVKQDSSLFISELESFRERLCDTLKATNNNSTFEPNIETKIKDDIAKIFETAPLLTLRNRQQLGLLNKVNPEWSAVNHTRYEHSIGVTAKCIVVCDYLNSITTDDHLKFTTQEVKELALAAALHDCGHLPMSHAVERAFLSSKFEKSDVSHEARIIPLLLRPNPYFEEIHKLTNQWIENKKDFESDSLYRVSAIISPGKTEGYIKNKIDFQYPKRAILQLLSSEIDLDRLDYIIRDARALKYNPVVLIEKDLLKYLCGLTLIKANTLKKGFENDVELCVNSKYLQYIFFFLVSRVLLYKYCYFSQKVRSFEAILTYLISDFLEKNIEINPLKLIPMSDCDFVDSYLDSLLQYITDKRKREHISTKYINVLKFDKVERFKFHRSIDTFAIKNPRLAKELEDNLNKYSYIGIIKNTIQEEGQKEKITIENEDLLLDVFSLKAGLGNLLVLEQKIDKETKKDTHELKILKNYMNGSNIHRLCTETRLDVYYKSDMGDLKRSKIDHLITRYYDCREE